MSVTIKTAPRITEAGLIAYLRDNQEIIGYINDQHAWVNRITVAIDSFQMTAECSMPFLVNETAEPEWYATPTSLVFDADGNRLTRDQIMTLVESHTKISDFSNFAPDLSETEFVNLLAKLKTRVRTDHEGQRYNEVELNASIAGHCYEMQLDYYPYLEDDVTATEDYEAHIEAMNFRVLDSDYNPLEAGMLNTLFMTHTQLFDLPSCHQETPVAEEEPSVDHVEGLEAIDDATLYVVPRDDMTDLRFYGTILGQVDNQDRSGGKGGRWTMLTLYLTQGENYICQKVGATNHDGEVVRYSGAVCENDDQIVEFFGYGWLAKELYADMAIECYEDID